MAINYNPSTVTSGLVVGCDATNPKSYSPNTFNNPTDLFSYFGTAGVNAATLSRDTIQSPVGNTPLKMVQTGNDPHTATYNTTAWNFSTAATGETWAVSCWVKASAPTTIEGPVLFASIANGTYVEAGSSSFTIGTNWTRVSFTKTWTVANIVAVQTRLDGTNSGGAGITVWWDGLQIERSSAVTNFNSKRNTNGTNWFDLTTNSYTGTLVNTPSFNTSNGGYMVFDGVNDHVTFTSPAWSNQVTIEAFVNLQTTTNGSGWLMGKEGAYRVLYGNGNFQWVCATVNNGWYTAGTAITGTVTNINTWVHLVCTYDGSYLRMYANGNLIQTGGTQISGAVLSNASQLNFMRPDAAGIDYGKGNIGLIKMYNRALTISEIKQNFNSIKGRFGL